MKMSVVADRVYRRGEYVRWGGSRVGLVVGFFDALRDGSAHALIEVSDRTFEALKNTGAARFILERGNMVEVYELGRTLEEPDAQ